MAETEKNVEILFGDFIERKIRRIFEQAKERGMNIDPKDKEFLNSVPILAEETAGEIFLGDGAEFLGSRELREKILKIATFFMAPGNTAEIGPDNIAKLFGIEEQRKNMLTELTAAVKKLFGAGAAIKNTAMKHVFTRIQMALLEAQQVLEDNLRV